MKLFKIIIIVSLFTLLMFAIFAGIAGMTGTLATMMGGGTALREKFLIPDVQFVAGSEGAEDTINVAVANVGYTSATITSCILKDETGNVVTSFELASESVLEKGTFKLITLTLNPDNLIDKKQYTLMVVTAAGSAFVSAAFDTASTAEYDALKDLDLQSMLQKSALSTPPPQGATTLYGPVYAPIPTSVIIGAGIVAAFSVLSAYPLSQRIAGSKNRKDRFVVFFLTSAIFVSIIVWFVYTIWGGNLAAM